MAYNCYKKSGFEVQQDSSASVNGLSRIGEGYTQGCFVRIEARACVNNCQIHINEGQFNSITIGEGVKLENACIKFAPFQDTVLPQMNLIRIEQSCGLNNLTVECQGTNNELAIGRNNHVTRSLGCYLRGAGNTISTGADTSIQEAYLIAAEIENRVAIAEDSMLANGITVRGSDDHPIYSPTNFERLNPAMPVSIGRLVWIGDHALVLRGSTIGAGSIVAAHTVITRQLQISERSRVIGTHTSQVLDQPKGEWARDLFFSTTSAQEQKYSRVCAESYRARANELSRVGRYREAQTNYERSIELYPHRYACSGLDHVLQMLRKAA